jgi:hypothetical protein
MQATLLLVLLMGPVPAAGVGEARQAWLLEREAPQDAIEVRRHADIVARLDDRVAALRRSGQLPAQEKATASI